MAGAVGVRLYPARGYRHAGLRSTARRRMGRRIGRDAAGAARYRDHLCGRRRSVPLALKAVRKGGRVVCARRHMSDIPSFPYRLLWEERQVIVGRQPDAAGWNRFSGPGTGNRHRPATTRYPLCQANQALADLRAGRFEGAAVLVP